MLADIFAVYGNVLSSNIVVKTPFYNEHANTDAEETLTNIYAYVDFEFPSSATAAAKAQVRLVASALISLDIPVLTSHRTIRPLESQGI